MSGKAGKPSIMISKAYKIYLGNETESELVISGIDLFGFNTGSFEFKIVRGSNTRDVSGIAWKLNSDIDMVLFEKKVIPICKVLHLAAVNHGIAEITINEHTLSPKIQRAVSWI